MKPFLFLCTFLCCGLLWGDCEEIVSWAPPQLILPKDHLKTPHVVTNPKGDVIAVWANNAEQRIEVSRFDLQELVWTAPELVFASEHPISSPKIALDAQGNANAIWVDMHDHKIVAARYEAGQTWSQPITLSGIEERIGSPQLIADKLGNMLAVWRRWNGINDSVQTSFYDTVSKQWSQPIDISPIGVSCSSPRMVFDKNNNAIAVWNATQPNWEANQHISVQAARFDGKTRTWSNPYTNSTLWSGFSDMHPKLAVDRYGNAFVIWLNRGNNETVVRVTNYSTENDKWSLPLDLTIKGLYRNCEIASDPFGNIIALWQSLEFPEKWIEYTHYNHDEKKWNYAKNLAAPHDIIHQLGITFDGSGNALAVWETTKKIEVSRYDYLQKRWSSPITAVTLEDQLVDALQLVMDPIGNAMISFENDSLLLYTFGNYLTPPKCLQVQRKKNRFAARTVYYSDLNWTPSASPNVRSYVIRCNGEKIAEIPHPDCGFRHRHIPQAVETYTLTSINAAGVESQPHELMVR